MRLLFSFAGGRGHFEPLVAIANAARFDGHGVAFACAPSMAEVVAGAGFATLPLGDAARFPSPLRLPLRPVDLERERQEFRERFVARAAQYRAPILANLCAQWRPDVLVCDETDYGAMIAAESQGIPHVCVLVFAAGGLVRPEDVGDLLDLLRGEHRLAPDPAFAMPSRHLVLAPFPAALRDPGHPLPATAHCFSPYRNPVGRTPNPKLAGVAFRPEWPTVYFTLGTVFNLESGDLFERVLRGLRELPANVRATVGTHIDPADVGPQPSHVLVERFVAQAVVLPGCDLVVSHGGSGTLAASLAHGKPGVLIPMGADQPLNAARCEQLGVACVLDPVCATAEDVREAAWSVLGSEAHRAAAARFRDEFAALPDASLAVSLIVNL